MADVNKIQLIGRLGADAEIKTTHSGREFATFSLATDTGWFDKETDEWHKNLHWHRVITFQPGLIDRLRERGKKGVRLLVEGELHYRSYRKDGETSDRREADIEIGNAGTINFIDSDRAAAP
nr:single-stranded DNA-binding protein [uncultured Acidocella sp.]